MNAPKIHEPPRKKCSRRSRARHLRDAANRFFARNFRLRRLVRDAFVERAERGAVERAARIKRIDEHFVISHTEDAHQKMARKRNTLRTHRNASRDFAINERERNRNSNFSIEHVRQKTIFRIVVVALVAAKAERRVHVMRDRARCVRRVHAIDSRVLDRRRELVEFRKKLFDVERRVNVTRDQRCAERDVFCVERVFRRELLERRARVHRAHIVDRI